MTERFQLINYFQLSVTHLDGRKARYEPMKVCTYYLEDICKNFATDGDGYLTFLSPSDASNSIEVSHTLKIKLQLIVHKRERLEARVLDSETGRSGFES